MGKPAQGIGPGTRFRVWRRAILLAVALVAFATPDRAHADDTSAPALTVPALHKYLRGATRGILLHETAHALIDILDLPAVGPEEDVADEFAAMVTINAAQESEIGHENVAALVDTSLTLWSQFKKSAAVGIGDSWVVDLRNLELYDSHSPNIRRAYHTLCLLYGAFPDRYSALPSNMGMDEGSAERCLGDYRRKARAWDRLLSPHAPVAGSTRSFVYTYEPSEAPKGRFYENLYLGFRDLEFLVANLLSNAISLPNPLPMFRGDCGLENAVYNPAEKAIVFCNELLHHLADGYVELATGQGYDDWWAAALKHRVDPKLNGRWRMIPISGPDGMSPGPPQDLEFKADGTFAWVIRWSQDPGLPHPDTERRGLWGVEDQRLWLLETEWVPGLPADCLTSGCEPPGSMDGLEARYAPIKWLDDNTFDYNNGIVFRREAGG